MCSRFREPTGADSAQALADAPTDSSNGRVPLDLLQAVGKALYGWGDDEPNEATGYIAVSESAKVAVALHKAGYRKSEAGALLWEAAQGWEPGGGPFTVPLPLVNRIINFLHGAAPPSPSIIPRCIACSEPALPGDVYCAEHSLIEEPPVRHPGLRDREPWSGGFASNE